MELQKFKSEFIRRSSNKQYQMLTELHSRYKRQPSPINSKNKHLQRSLIFLHRLIRCHVLRPVYMYIPLLPTLPVLLQLCYADTVVVVAGIEYPCPGIRLSYLQRQTALQRQQLVVCSAVLQRV
jgi:hypothetical protein